MKKPIPFHSVRKTGSIKATEPTLINTTIFKNIERKKSKHNIIQSGFLIAE